MSRPDGMRRTRREEIRPSGVTLTRGLLIASTKSFVCSSETLASSSFAASSWARRISSSMRSLSRSARSRRISSIKSRSLMNSLSSKSPLGSRSMKSSRSKEYSTKGITLKRTRLLIEQEHCRCQHPHVRGSHTPYRIRLLRQHCHHQRLE